MILKYNPKLKKLSRFLRKNMTLPEVLLWKKLQKKQILGYQFYRQKPLGNYIVDFFCPKAKLIIELDGSQHLKEAEKKKDMERDDYFRKNGLKVMRFYDKDILENSEGVVFEILKYLENLNSY